MKQEQYQDREIEIRECTRIEEFDACIRLQRDAFGLPDLEISPRRHLIVSRKAGGWTLGAFTGGRMVGFVHQMVALRGVSEIIGYSHMMAVSPEHQSRGIGARLKWAQRDRALSQGLSFIQWTWNPMQARNAHFNLNRLGAVVRRYAANLYGTDYNEPVGGAKEKNIDSDRLFAGWNLTSEGVTALAEGRTPRTRPDPIERIEIPSDWQALLEADAELARRELLRVRTAFEDAFASGLVCAGFYRGPSRPAYLLFNE
jgi:predicted GNAT superfamily acetyltransferase